MVALLGVAIWCCSGAQQAAEHSALACVGSAAERDLVPTVESIVINGAANWAAQLTALAVAFGSQLVDCAATLAKAELVARLSAGSGSMTATQRLDDWLAHHGAAQ